MRRGNEETVVSLGDRAKGRKNAILTGLSRARYPSDFVQNQNHRTHGDGAVGYVERGPEEHFAPVRQQEIHDLTLPDAVDDITDGAAQDQRESS